MKYHICRFNGKDRKEGRFGSIKTGDELALTSREYAGVRDDPDFTHLREEEREQRPGPASVPTTPPEIIPPEEPKKKTKPKEPGSVTASEPAEQEEEDGEEEGEEGSGEEDEPIDYSALTVDQLRQEISERNKGREKKVQISASGGKSKLVEALEKDDAFLRG